MSNPFSYTLISKGKRNGESCTEVIVSHTILLTSVAGCEQDSSLWETRGIEWRWWMMLKNKREKERESWAIGCDKSVTDCFFWGEKFVKCGRYLSRKNFTDLWSSQKKWFEIIFFFLKWLLLLSSDQFEEEVEEGEDIWAPDQFLQNYAKIFLSPDVGRSRRRRIFSWSV